MFQNHGIGIYKVYACIMLLMAVSCVMVFAQPGNTEIGTGATSSFNVKWISQYPGDNSTERISFGERISGLVFGKKSSQVVKPFNIVASDPESFCILDQGSGSLLFINKGEVRDLKSMKKSGSEFPSLVGICMEAGGDMFFTDSRLNQLHRVSEKQVIQFADSVSFNQPTGIAYSEVTGEVWVAETAAHRITVMNSEGKIVKRIGSRGSGPLAFNFPTFIWIDSTGQVYIIDSMNFRVQVLDRDGNFLFTFGESGDATGNMARPKGVATDSYGNIYVADALFHVIQIFDKQGNFLYSFGSQGQRSGQFWMPAGVFIDKKDHIYVADSYNSRIQIFQLINN